VGGALPPEQVGPGSGRRPVGRRSYPVEILAKDSQSDPERAATVANDLLRREALVVADGHVHLYRPGTPDARPDLALLERILEGLRSI
jgi:hypothetical protein